MTEPKHVACHTLAARQRGREADTFWGRRVPVERRAPSQTGPPGVSGQPALAFAADGVSVSCYRQAERFPPSRSIADGFPHF